MRNIADLQKEAKAQGLEVLPSGKKLSKEDYEIALRNHYWLQKHDSLDTMLPQIEPAMAQNIKDLTEVEAESTWNGADYVAQEKLDGARFLCFINGSGTRFTARRKSDKTYLYNERTDNLPYHTALHFPDLHGTVLDGEVKMNVAVIETESVKTVTELQATIAAVNGRPELSKMLQDKYGAPTYHVFDILYYKGENVMHKTYRERLQLLGSVMEQIAEKDPQYRLFSQVMTEYGSKRSFYDRMVKEGKEGAMLKSLSSTYQPGKRTWDWLKVKRFEEWDTVITGVVDSDKEAAWADLIGAIEVSVYDEDGKLRPVASFGSMPLEFRRAVTITENGKPTLRKDLYGKVVVVRGQEFTKAIRLKHAVCVPYGGWENPFRDDKAPEQCTAPLKKIAAKIEAGMRV